MADEELKKRKKKSFVEEMKDKIVAGYDHVVEEGYLGEAAQARKKAGRRNYNMKYLGKK